MAATRMLLAGALALASVAAAAPVPVEMQVPAAQYHCATKADAADADLSSGMGWACGAGGINCAPIQPGGAHYQPNTLAAHASW